MLIIILIFISKVKARGGGKYIISAQTHLIVHWLYPAHRLE